ncbi:histidine kinase [Streptomyces sp. NPDC001743]|uniref:sensor histidine kinase n=1 Tax=Streptomyces sp. NPDC001743 TaxID=3154397 RepID=UPI0033276A13
MNLWWVVPTGMAAFLTGRRPGRTTPTALALAGILAVGVVALSVVPAWLPLAGRFVTVIVAAMMLPWFAGRFWCQYQQLVRAGWERADQLQREQQLIADQARLRERARIAQDMHDVLGHDLSLIALSAGALKLAPGLEEHHRNAAGDIRARAAAAVERLGEVIGVLREETGTTPMDSNDSSLATLTSEASAAGLKVELRIDGEADDPPPVVGQTAHRVVQEALTNVAKHASGAAVTVHVTHTADPRDYARLRVGQDRSEVERHLPDRQANPRPLTAEPTGDGITCEYYAMTADRFDDRSGDAYRLCFRKDILVSLDTITP